jgi:hypothetical protein
MRDYLVIYLRLIGFSVCTLAVALCMRFGQAHAALPSPEPRYSAPPRDVGMAAASVLQTEEEQVASLEANLTALSSEVAELTRALEVLGPLPDHPELFIPVMLTERDEPAPSTEMSRRYSPVASSTSPLCDMPYAGLGVFGGLHRFAADLGAPACYEAAPHNVRFDLELAEDATIAALCVELSALAGAPCVVAPMRAW